MKDIQGQLTKCIREHARNEYLPRPDALFKL